MERQIVHTVLHFFDLCRAFRQKTTNTHTRLRDLYSVRRRQCHIYNLYRVLERTTQPTSPADNLIYTLQYTVWYVNYFSGYSI